MNGGSLDQSSKLYAFEEAFFPTRGMNLLELHEIVAYVDNVWKRLSLKGTPPKVYDGRGSPNARACADTIHIPKWGRNHVIVVHELSHCLCERLGIDHHGHGPDFTHVYFSLIARLQVHHLPYQDIVNAAGAYGVLVDDIGFFVGDVNK